MVALQGRGAVEPQAAPPATVQTRAEVSASQEGPKEGGGHQALLIAPTLLTLLPYYALRASDACPVGRARATICHTADRPTSR